MQNDANNQITKAPVMNTNDDDRYLYPPSDGAAADFRDVETASAGSGTENAVWTPFTLFGADTLGIAGNCSYPHRLEIRDAESLRRAVCHDYVCAEYRDNYRKSANFLQTDCLAMDCDNDHSEDPAQWVTPQVVADCFPGVRFAVHYSRNHLKEKNGKAGRPKFHTFFPVETIRDSGEYSRLKKRVHSVFPYFDANALDAARFFFGTAEPEVELFPGTLLLSEFFNEELPGEDFDAALPQKRHGEEVIPEGSRNSTMYRFAVRVLKRLGCTDEAYDAFLQHAARCDPPLDDKELSAIWASAQNFYHEISSREDYVPPEEYRPSHSAGDLQPEDYSELGEAKLLVREFGNELRYSEATDFLRYDGIRWREDRIAALGAVEELLDLQLADADALSKTSQSSLMEAGIPEEIQRMLLQSFEGSDGYSNFVMEQRNYLSMKHILNAAAPMISIEVADLDRDPYLLNTPEGTVDLKAPGAPLRKHDPEDLITKVTGCSPGTEGKELWEDALDRFFCGDRDLIRYVQEIIGSAAIGKVFLEALIIAYGEGRNGKSTFWNAIAKVFGSYAGSLSADTLTVGCRRNVKPELAELRSLRLVIASELEEGTRLSTSILKQLCSTDILYGEKKFKAPFGFVPSHTLALCTNHLPRVGATDEGTWRRLIVIPFLAKMEGSNDIKNYADYLFENAGPYILTWIIEGAKMAIRDDFKFPVPPVVQEAIGEYRGQNDWLDHFLTECCELAETLETKSGELYQEYRAYCLRNGEYTRNTTDFYAALDKAGFQRHKKSSGMWVRGIRLKADDFLS